MTFIRAFSLAFKIFIISEKRLRHSTQRYIPWIYGNISQQFVEYCVSDLFADNNSVLWSLKKENGEQTR